MFCCCGVCESVLCSGTVTCTLCPAGEFFANSGATVRPLSFLFLFSPSFCHTHVCAFSSLICVLQACTKCNLGEYQLALGQDRCTPCEGQTVAPLHGMAACIPCVDNSKTIDATNCLCDIGLPSSLSFPSFQFVNSSFFIS